MPKTCSDFLGELVTCYFHLKWRVIQEKAKLKSSTANFLIPVVWLRIEPWTPCVLCKRGITTPQESKGGHAKKIGYLNTVSYEIYKQPYMTSNYRFDNMIFKYQFFCPISLAFTWLVVAHLQRTREVQGSIPSQTTGIEKLTVEDFNLAFSCILMV